MISRIAKNASARFLKIAEERDEEYDEIHYNILDLKGPFTTNPHTGVNVHEIKMNDLVIRSPGNEFEGTDHTFLIDVDLSWAGVGISSGDPGGYTVEGFKTLEIDGIGISDEDAKTANGVIESEISHMDPKDFVDDSYDGD